MLLSCRHQLREDGVGDVRIALEQRRRLVELGAGHVQERTGRGRASRDMKKAATLSHRGLL
jgi:hypothetical protein